MIATVTTLLSLAILSAVPSPVSKNTEPLEPPRPTSLEVVDLVDFSVTDVFDYPITKALGIDPGESVHTTLCPFEVGGIRTLEFEGRTIELHRVTDVIGVYR